MEESAPGAGAKVEPAVACTIAAAANAPATWATQYGMTSRRSIAPRTSTASVTAGL